MATQLLPAPPAKVDIIAEGEELLASTLKIIFPSRHICGLTIREDGFWITNNRPLVESPVGPDPYWKPLLTSTAEDVARFALEWMEKLTLEQRRACDPRRSYERDFTPERWRARLVIHEDVDEQYYYARILPD